MKMVLESKACLYSDEGLTSETSVSILSFLRCRIITLIIEWTFADLYGRWGSACAPPRTPPAYGPATFDVPATNLARVNEILQQTLRINASLKLQNKVAFFFIKAIDPTQKWRRC